MLIVGQPTRYHVTLVCSSHKNGKHPVFHFWTHFTYGTIKIYNFFNKIFTIFETILLDSWRNRLQGNLRRPLVGRSVADTVSNLTERPIFSRKSFVFVPHGGPHPQISRLFLCVVGFSRGGHLRVLTYDQSFHV